MSRQRKASLAFILLLSAVALFFAAGCGTGDEAEPVAGAQTPMAVPAANTGSTTTVPLPFDALSTFESKDPFVPKVAASQSAASNTTATTAAAATTTTSIPATTTTTNAAPATTTTTKGPATTTTTAVHSLKVLAIEVISGLPVVTFEVDRSVYADRREGDIASTSWGQIKVVDIDPEAAEVVFLHGSEIRVLKVGQEFLK